MAVRALCLFDGYGGFELGLKLALGPDNVRTVARVERDSHAAATLVARMEETTLDSAPVWDDVTSFDGRPWRGRVDLITAGFNCQPFSAAGRGLGVDDERWLWPDIARIVAEVGPRLVFVENVPGLVRLGGLDRVCGDLADLGFDAEWGLFSAAAVGATHRRERFWLLGWMGDADGGRGGVGQRSDRARRRMGRDTDRSGGTHGAEAPDRRRVDPDAADIAHRASEDVAESDHHGQQHAIAHPPARRLGPASGCSEHMADTLGEVGRQPAGRAESGNGGDSPFRAGPAESGRRRCDPWPPGPDDRAGWDRWRAAGGPQPSIRRSTPRRPMGLAESLHLGGNGLVPRVAAEAFAALAMRAGIARLIDA